MWLVFEIRSATANTLVVKVNTNAWGAFIPGRLAVDYAVIKELAGSDDWQTVSISLSELTSTDPKITEPLSNWRTVTELSISPSGEAVKDGRRVKVDGKPWQGPRDIRNLRGRGANTPHIHPTSTPS